MRWLQEAEMNRWIELVATSPSGKALFVCRYCGDVTPIPAKVCPTPPMMHGKPHEKTCHEIEAEAGENLIHPILRNAIPRLSTLVASPAKAKSTTGKMGMLRDDRELVLRVVRQVVASKGAGPTVRIWDLLDELEDVRKELMKK